MFDICDGKNNINLADFYCILKLSKIKTPYGNKDMLHVVIM